MIKFDTDQWIRSNKTNETKHIIVESKLPCKPVHLIVGLSLITYGVCYLMVNSFKHGALEFNEAEYRTLDSLGLLKDPE